MIWTEIKSRSHPGAPNPTKVFWIITMWSALVTQGCINTEQPKMFPGGSEFWHWFTGVQGRGLKTGFLWIPVHWSILHETKGLQPNHLGNVVNCLNSHIKGCEKSSGKDFNTSQDRVWETVLSDYRLVKRCGSTGIHGEKTGSPRGA